MRILLLDQFAELGGAQRCLLDVAEGFAARGWEVHAAAPEGDLLDRLRPHCRTVRTLPCGPFQSRQKTAADAIRMLPQLLKQVSILKQAIRDAAIDIVYVNGPRVMPAAALARSGAQAVFHAHSIVEQPAASAMLRASLWAAEATVIASSHFVATGLGASRIILNGVRDYGRPRRSGPTTVAVLGRISPEKGQLEFVRAVRALPTTGNCRSIVAGAAMFGADAYAAKVQEEARAAGIECTGWVHDVPGFLAGVDVLVVSSDCSDATPRVILEAFSAGTTVIAFAVGGIPELVRDGVDGFLVRERTVEALAHAIQEAIRCPERLVAMTGRARCRWHEAFTVARFQNDIAEAVQAIAQRRHQRSPLASTGTIAEA